MLLLWLLMMIFLFCLFVFFLRRLYLHTLTLSLNYKLCLTNRSVLKTFLDKHQLNLTSLDEKRFLVFCLVLQDACDQTVLLPFFLCGARAWRFNCSYKA